MAAVGTSQRRFPQFTPFGSGGMGVSDLPLTTPSILHSGFCFTYFKNRLRNLRKLRSSHQIRSPLRHFRTPVANTPKLSLPSQMPPYTGARTLCAGDIKRHPIHIHYAGLKFMLSTLITWGFYVNLNPNLFRPNLRTISTTVLLASAALLSACGGSSSPGAAVTPVTGHRRHWRSHCGGHGVHQMRIGQQHLGSHQHHGQLFTGYHRRCVALPVACELQPERCRPSAAAFGSERGWQREHHPGHRINGGQPHGRHTGCRIRQL